MKRFRLKKETNSITKQERWKVQRSLNHGENEYEVWEDYYESDIYSYTLHEAQDHLALISLS